MGEEDEDEEKEEDEEVDVEEPADKLEEGGICRTELLLHAFDDAPKRKHDVENILAGGMID